MDEKRIFLLSNVFQKKRCVSIAYQLRITTYDQNHTLPWYEDVYICIKNTYQKVFDNSFISHLYWVLLD